MPRAEAESAPIVSIPCDASLMLVDPRGDRPVLNGASKAAAQDGNRAAGRALSGAVNHSVRETAQ